METTIRTMEFPYKDIIKNRISEKGREKARWIKECEDDGFFCKTKGFWLMPNPSGCHREKVYLKDGICCNTISIASYKKDECLYFDDKRVCSGIYSVEGESCVGEDDEVKRHIGEVYICISRGIYYGEDDIELDDRTTYLTLDEVEKVNAGFLKELVFHLN